MLAIPIGISIYAALGAAAGGVYFAIRYLLTRFFVFATRPRVIKRANVKCPECSSFNTAGKWSSANLARSSTSFSWREIVKVAIPAAFASLFVLGAIVVAGNRVDYSLGNPSLIGDLLGEDGLVWLYKLEDQHLGQYLALFFGAALSPVAMMILVLRMCRLPARMRPTVIGESWRCRACHYVWTTDADALVGSTAKPQS